MPTVDHTIWTRRCLQLAALGAGRVAPNPMVGAVLVQGQRILAEGWHQRFGGPHAEVECLRAFGDGPIPDNAILYVNLEPCAHHGKTPPCTDLLVKRGVKHVVIGQRDPFPAVSGKGIAILKTVGIAVTEDLLSDECRWSQRRFLTSMEQGRPYIILKWAQSRDGFLDQHPRTGRSVHRISGAATDVLVHRWRSKEQAILVGSRTVVNDDPSLTVRHVEGLNPLRVVIDRKAITPAISAVYNNAAPTLLLTGREREDIRVEQCIIPVTEDPITALMNVLHERTIRSLLVEGGAEILNHFIARGLWDEARVITGTAQFGAGTPAPSHQRKPTLTLKSGDDRIELITNGDKPFASWDW